VVAAHPTATLVTPVASRRSASKLVLRNGIGAAAEGDGLGETDAVAPTVSDGVGVPLMVSDGDRLGVGVADADAPVDSDAVGDGVGVVEGVPVFVGVIELDGVAAGVGVALGMP